MVACLSYFTTARLAQSAERKALNLVVVGSSPTVGAFLIYSWVLFTSADLAGRYAVIVHTLHHEQPNCADKTNEGREIRTPNLLIWSQTRYRCATESL